MIDELVVWMGSRFSDTDYLFWTRIQSFAWTAADVVIVYYLLRCADLARRWTGRAGHRVPYFVLAATLTLAPCLAVAPNGRMIFGLELLITVPHFVLILYVLFANVRTFERFARELLGDGNGT